MKDILRLVSEMDRRTLPTLCQLSENDIDSIWADVSAFIERQMFLHKGVHLAGLGTFTFSQEKLDIGNKFIMIQRPEFLLAGKLTQSLGLKQARPLAAATHLPVVQLNFAAVSQETPYSRDTVEGCIRETLRLLFTALASEQNVFVTFVGIGVLSFKNNKVQMKFNRDFINAMDGSGRLLLAFNKRPGSSISLLSGGLSRLQRPQTANPTTLPTVCSPQPDNKAEDKDGWCLSPATDQRIEGEVPKQREPKSLQTLQTTKMKAVGLSRDLNPEPPVEATDKYYTDRQAHTLWRSSVYSAQSCVCRTTNSLLPPEVSPKLREPRVSVSCSGHTRAGQELCYLCMQRAQRNVPLYLKEQQKAEEKAQEKLLLLKEQQKDKQYMEKEQARLNKQREQGKQVATFNLQKSEKREKTPQYPTSFIFLARPITPSRRIQQHSYMKDLQSQIERQEQHEARDQKNRLLIERLDQHELVSTSERPCYQTTSGSQGGLYYVLFYGNCTTKLFQANFNAATQRKNQELHNHQAQLEKEREMLKQSKLELILDNINHYKKKQDIGKSLGDEWSLGMHLKHQREDEERRFLRSAGQLLVDKLTQYKCCAQCKRRTTNCGETNIWKDSQYLSGSQFMI
ncbi:Coiled-coil domain-containing protein 81 [Channa argus]|uniref:Coiled-coil domain-containing protein 81 n=1 Tax=Channa argus TaxID=215402 RepID=A0A6G1P8I7_CHAAH|nr:Coiled-coil domain-containing protein 81 [Channa argus]